MTHTSIVIIDPSVEDYQVLIDGVVEGAEVFVLDAHRDGIHQITDYLAKSKIQNPKSKIQNLHIVSHGAPGTLYLGNGELSLGNLNRYAEELQSWFNPKSKIQNPKSDLLLYGCNVASGDAGEEFLAKLNALTGATIAASTTPIGNADLGGNWELDTASKTDLAFNAEVTANYAGTFAIDTDGDGVNDDVDLDDDNDGIKDSLEIGTAASDTDGDGIPNYNGPLDVVFVLDTSGSIDETEWDFFSQTVNQTSTLLQQNASNAQFAVTHLSFYEVTGYDEFGYPIQNYYPDGYVVQSDFTASPPTVQDKLGSANDFGTAIAALKTELVDGDGVLDTRANAQTVIVYFTDALADEIGSVWSVNGSSYMIDPANEFKTALPDAEIVTIQIGQEDDPNIPITEADFAVAAALSTQGGTYTGTVNSYDSDPEGPGVGPRRFTGGDFEDVNAIAQIAAENTLFIQSSDASGDPLDADGDGIPDSLDLDSDNDGIPDNVEAQLTNGYIAPGVFTDTDGDGLNDVYDSDNGGVDIIPINTDDLLTNSDISPDYIDTDSDGDGISDTDEAGLTLNTLTVGTNGLDDDMESADDYSDPNGTLNDPTTLPDSNGDLGTGGDVDFRQAASAPPVEETPSEQPVENKTPSDNLTAQSGSLSARIADLNQPIRDYGVDGLTIQFSEKVRNFDVTDIKLSLDGVAVDLTGATLVSADEITWFLSNIPGFAEASGNYQIDLSQSDVMGYSGNSLLETTGTDWLTGYTADPRKKPQTGGETANRRKGTSAGEGIPGTNERDILNGRPGDDRMRGKDGNDKMIGGGGDDKMSGGRGNDQLSGRSGNDRLLGRSGDDRLVGSGGNDILKGGSGDDLLFGKKGRDIMTGGRGEDTFLFRKLSADRDKIRRFNADDDVIDVRRIFKKDAFSADNRFAQFVEHMELVQSGSSTKVQIDKDGNGSGDKMITLVTLLKTDASDISSENFVIGKG